MAWFVLIHTYNMVKLYSVAANKTKSLLVSANRAGICFVLSVNEAQQSRRLFEIVEVKNEILVERKPPQ